MSLCAEGRSALERPAADPNGPVIGTILAFLVGVCFMLVADSIVVAFGGDLRSSRVVPLAVLLVFLVRRRLANLYEAYPRVMLRVGLLLLALDIGAGLLIRHLRSP